MADKFEKSFMKSAQLVYDALVESDNHHSETLAGLVQSFLELPITRVPRIEDIYVEEEKPFVDEFIRRNYLTGVDNTVGILEDPVGAVGLLPVEDTLSSYYLLCSGSGATVHAGRSLFVYTALFTKITFQEFGTDGIAVALNQGMTGIIQKQGNTSLPFVLRELEDDETQSLASEVNAYLNQHYYLDQQKNGLQ